MLCTEYVRRARPVLVAAAVFAAAAVAADPQPSTSQQGDGLRLVAAVLPQAPSQADRVAAAVRLRSLSQKIHATACRVQSGIVREAALSGLRDARRDMAHLLAALEHGNPAFGIEGAETRRATLARLHDVRALWEGLRAPVTDVIEGRASDATFGRLHMFDAVLHDAAGVLVSEVSGQYSHPFELLQADALALDIVGRQAALAHRVAYRACAVGRGSDEAREALTRDVAALALGLAALRDGLPEAGLRPAPTTEIADALAAVQGDWPATAESLANAQRPDAPSEALHDAVARMAVLAAQMEGIASLYTAHARRSGW